MEIIISFAPYYIFAGDTNDTFGYFNSVCEKLSQISICESMGIDIQNITPSDKEELINYISSQEYTLWLDFIPDEPPPAPAFRINAKSGTEGDYFFRSAVIFELMGMKDLCYAMRMEFYGRVANDMFKDILGQEVEKDVISHINKAKASKPRHVHYEEVISVIKATWEKYPCASQTGLHEALCSHYYGKVSRNSLLKWISDSGLRPEKPKKHSAFQLVFPQ